MKILFMAHEAKLEVLTISLHATTPEGKNTFAQYLESEFKPKRQPVDYESLYKKFFAGFLKKIDNTYHADSKRQKAIGVKPKRGEQRQKSISYASEKKMIYGTIKGGRYGQNRSIGDIMNPALDHDVLGKQKVVLDDFYFLLYTPLGSNKCVLILQSYTDDSIKDIFISFLRGLLKADGFYKPNVANFCPSQIKDEFKKNSVVKIFKYRHDIIVSDIENNNNILSKDVVVEVKVTVKDEGIKIGGFKKFRTALEKIGIKKPNTNTITLENFNTKIGTLADGSHISSFELDSNFDVMPTIFLSNRIAMQDDGTPDWDSLDQYSKKLLEEMLKEIYPENEALKN